MNVITITSDFGAKDFFFSQIKGMFCSIDNSPSLVEISHEIEPFNLIEAAYVVRNTYHYYPKGTIHIVSVGVQSYERYVVAKINDHYFISADNGVLALIFSDLSNVSFYEIKKGNSKRKS